MMVSVLNPIGDHEVVHYGAYEEDAQRKNAALSAWVDGLVARLKMPWFVPNLKRVEGELAQARKDRSE